MSPKRPAFTLFQLLVILAILALLFALFLPAVVKLRAAAPRAEPQLHLKQLGLACHNYQSTFNALPPGLDAKGFSAAAYLLPYIEQDKLYQQIKFKKPVDDEANKKVAAVVVKTFLAPPDPVTEVSKDYGATNYLFNAGSEYSLKDNNGVFYRDSKSTLAKIINGTSNTVMIGETLKGDGGTKATDLRRQYVLLKKDDLKNLTDDSGAKEWKDGKNIAGHRGQSWMDGRFLQGTFTGTRTVNDDKPDVDCGGAGGLSGLRAVGDATNIAMCDGSVRVINAKVKLTIWKHLTNKDNREAFPLDF
jgi:prepilin-type processing-associated H-X9-DG protein